MTFASPYFEDVGVGDALPELVTTVGRAQMFLFSAVTNNAHRIHYDKSWAVDVEGFPDIVVHGPLHGALMQRTVTDWMGPDGRMVTYSVRHSGPGFAEQTLHFKGQVVGKRQEDGMNLVDVEVKETNAKGDPLGASRFAVALPSRGGAA